MRNIFGSDFHVILAVVGRDDYGLRDLVLPESPTILDIGGNIGTFSLFAARCFPSSVIYTFEPEADNYRHLCEHIERNNLRTITPIQKGVAEKSGFMELYVQAGKTGSHSIVNGGAGVAQRIPVVTLEEFMRENKIEEVHLCKMDIEGAEYDILFQAPTSVLERMRHIVLEVHTHPAHTPEQLLSFLESAGFNITRSKTSKRIWHAVR